MGSDTAAMPFASQLRPCSVSPEAAAAAPEAGGVQCCVVSLLFKLANPETAGSPYGKSFEPQVRVNHLQAEGHRRHRAPAQPDRE